MLRIHNHIVRETVLKRLESLAEYKFIRRKNVSRERAARVVTSSSVPYL